MFDKIVGAFTFRAGVYKEVEEDSAFTPTAWMIVAAVAFLSALGACAVVLRSSGAGRWIIGSIGSAIFAVLGFALACFVVDWVGRTFFNAEVNFEEVVRTLGLAYVWNIVGFLGILSVSPVLGFTTGIFRFVGAVAGFAAWLIAAKEALDLEWPQTIGTIIIGWVVTAIVTAVAGLILGGLGLAGATTIGLFH